MANNQERGTQQDTSAVPDPEERTPTERRNVEHTTSFQGDTQQMPLSGDDAVDHGGTSQPPISAIPIEEVEAINDHLPVGEKAARSLDR